MITLPVGTHELSQSATAILWIAFLPAATWVLCRVAQGRHWMPPYVVAAVATVLWAGGLLLLAFLDGRGIANVAHPRWDRIAPIMIFGFAGSWILCRILVRRATQQIDLKAFD